ncbi:RHS repeat-associated core domain-containing protein [Lysobacter sp. CFH 32150]|uniref:RHS repeat domain-containing protein n=1 Tax=Lysobacter sp. CFH 32150 TaxID=2927128 RepID=UPI001FA742FD|nr:RHS repeat-associated core domain-containing protein [Lysobacter sp. CFH 32150]MCI4566930.1 hypothetical protein [Lysobacter sp. CFH 32150]
MKHIGIASALTLGMLLALPAQAQTYTRTDTIAYEDNLSLWVIGQQKSSTNVNTGLVESQTDYDPATALPIRTYAFGKLQQTLTYDTTSAVTTGQRGTLKTVSDGRDGTLNTTITLSSWKRGIPQLIQFPATPESPTGSSKSAVVNNNGWLDSVTDENKYKTCYRFDAMGRLTGITYPSETQLEVCDTSKWVETTQTFAPVAATEYGIPAGHWKQTVSTGNGRQVTYYDALWRPLVSERYDTANTAGTLSQTVTRYDAGGHAVYQSYPMQGLTGYTVPTQGIRTSYDALERVTRVEQDSELGVLATTTEYLTGFQTRVTNPRLKVTTTSYLTYDQPSTDWPKAIVHPAGAYTDIARDVFGKPTSLTRRDVASTKVATRTYTYFSDTQELCRTVEPETGATLMGYDAAGNLSWSAAGLLSTTPCDKEGDTAAILARRASRTYDARNRVKTLTFPDDGLGDTTYDYWADGQLKSLVAQNDGGTLVTSTYDYNRRRLLSGESLVWNGNINWPITYTYNANGHLASQVWHGVTVDYVPNALGQPTKAGVFASSVSYFPNGAMKQFTYGNGIVHTLTQNTRQLPDRSKDVYSTSPAVLDDSYDFDANGNVAAISDGLADNRGNRTMTYDDLDRLTATTSPMFGTGAVYAYDVLDNLTRAKMGATPQAPARDHYFCYDANWRLAFVRSGPVCTGTASPAVDALIYDEQGNVKSKDAQTFAFDYGNRLRSENTLASSSSYVYDGHGRRVRDTTTAEKYSHYTLDGRLAMTGDARANTVSEYVQLNGSLIAIRERDVATNVYTYKYQHTDALGSPVAVTDASRNVIERSEYEPYGKVLNRAVHDGPGYTGHVEDAATGLTYMQQRYYDPSIGMMLSVDPVTAYEGDMRHFNRYAYAYNNPYKFTDPDGRCPLCGAAVGAGIDAATQGLLMAAGVQEEFDTTSVMVSAGTGALGVGLAGRLGKLGGILGDVVVSVTSSALKGDDITVEGVLMDVAAGQGGTKLATQKIMNSPATKVAQRQANRLERIGNRPGARPAQAARAQSATPALQKSVAQQAARTGIVASGVGSAGLKGLQEKKKEAE